MAQAVATRYARALVDSVLDPKSQLEPGQALDELQSLQRMLADSTELRSILLSPAVSGARKRSVVARLAEILPLSRLVRNFMYVLMDRRRIDILDEAAQAFQDILDERLGIVRADVSSAMPLSDSQKSALGEELSRMTGKQVRCEFTRDETLLGGVVARIGSTVYDGSVRTQLDNLRGRLVSR
ncbi:MAG: ATP synthase F1 subunit delta [Bryobacteraceae bacterium]